LSQKSKLAVRMSVLITGGTRGLGFELTKKFIAYLGDPAKVHITGRDPMKLKLIAAQLGVCHVCHDLSEPSKITTLFDYIQNHHIDTLVVNAAIYPKISFNTLDYIQLLNINLVSSVLLMNYFYEYRQNHKNGTIISINSLAGLYPNAEERFYCASKFGLTGFVQSIQEKCSYHNIKVCEYYFGAMKTEMAAGRKDYDSLICPQEAADMIVNNLNAYRSHYSISQKVKKLILKHE